MKSAQLPDNEELRLKTLREYKILDTMAEQEFDDLTQIASAICGTSIALVSLVDEDRQWFKSKVGLDAEETNRDIAFCSHAILQEGVFLIEDAQKDERFHDNPLVTQAPNIRFYAGAPLKAHNGQSLGTLCVIDQKPMALSKDKVAALAALGRQVELLFELRRQNANVLKTQKELAEKNAQLLINSKHQTRFMNHVSHEIRTPLNAIVGFSDILSHRLPVEHNDADDSNHKLINHVKLAALGLTDIVNHVLDVSRIEAGKMQLDLTHIRCKNLLEEVTIINQTRAQEKDVSLTFEIAVDVPDVIVIDKVKVTQILVNLVGNAVKFTPSDKSVKVKVSQQDNQILFSVIDEGVGISKEQQRLVFEPFQQIDNVLTSQYVGSGLGLTICRELTEFLDGKIWLESIPGEGSTFSVSIPYQIGDNTKVEELETVIDINLSGKSLLIVEDNPVNQLVIKTYLKHTEANVDVMSDGQSAINHLSSNKPDLILLDLGLPDMTGLELLESLSEELRAEIPVIIVSGDVTEESLKQAKNLNVVEFLKKPVRKNQLMAAIASFVEPSN